MARKANATVNFSNLHTEHDWEELCKRQVVSFFGYSYTYIYNIMCLE